MHEALHQMKDPGRHAHLLENIKEEGVVYRIEGLSRVDEEEKRLLLFEEGCIKAVRDCQNVILEITPSAVDESFLTGLGSDKNLRLA